MFGGLPATIDPIQLAGKGARLRGKLPVKAMRRLVELCRDDSGEAVVDLMFERGDAGEMYLMHGTMAATVRVTCQRCLEGMDLELAAEPRLILTRPGEREDIQAQEAGILVVDKPISLSELVEDEFLLVMPMIPMHDEKVCPVSVYKTAANGVGAGDKINKPFSILNGLKRKE